MHQLSSSMVLALAFIIVLTEGAPAHLWSDCFPSAYGQLCATLDNTPPCDLTLKVAMSGINVWTEDFNLAIQTQVCKDVSITGCNFCVVLENLEVGIDGQVHPCIYLNEECGSNTTITPLGCITESNTLAQCLTQGCPNDCSGKGQCLMDQCFCNDGWYGDDCSQQAPIFDQCATVGNYGDLCLRMEFEGCGIQATVYPKMFPSLVLYQYDVPAPQFNTYFSTAQCFSVQSCSACLFWNDLTLNETFAHGCPSVNMTCAGMSFGPVSYGCFEDDTLAPACFGNCSNNCMHNSSCVNGQCQCSSGYMGQNCAKAICDELNYCSEHGNCVSPNNCLCNPGFTGASCSEITCKEPCQNNGICSNGVCKCASGWKGDACADSVTHNGGTPAAVYVVVGLVVGLVVSGAVGAAGFFVLRYKRQQRTGRAFSSLDDGLIQVPDSPENSRE